MKKKYYFTVFIPAYNRAHTLMRLFDSLERQTFKDFEVIVVDDGSTDNTSEIVETYMKKSSYDLQYIFQENSGKPTARNNGIDLAKGMLFKTIDSDDIVTDDCLQIMKEVWESISPAERKGYAGVIGLCADLNTKKVIGDKFPQEVFDSNHLVNSLVYNIQGDKTQCIRTDILRDNKFPIIEGEKFISEGIVWNRIGKDYQFRYINKVLMYKEYLAQGISNNSIKTRVGNCKSSRFYYQEYVNDILTHYDVPRIHIYKGYSNYVRFSLHCKTSFINQVNEINNLLYYFAAFPLGLYLFINDKKVIGNKSDDE